MTTRERELARLAIFGFGALVLGCQGGPGGLARLLRPKEPSAAAALGEAPGATECRDVSGAVRPLIVDLKPEQRGDLEVAMREGVAIVRYDCGGLTLLTECHAEGSYGFKGVVLKQQVIRLADEDEVRANLPLTGVAVAARLGSALERGTTLDLATALVGNVTSTRVRVDRAELAGSCEGASHFVRGANVGAFVMQTGSATESVTAAQLFGAGADAGSASSRLARVEDGRLADCERATPDASDPPGNCRALIRLHLIPITGGAPATAVAAAAPAPATAPAGEAAPAATATDPTAAPAATSSAPGPTAAASAAGATATPEEDDVGCPDGLVLSEGKCVAPDRARAHVCAGDDAADCRTQCDAGDAASCARLASLLARGIGVTADPAAAASYYGKACAMEHGVGCTRLGILTAQGKGTPRDETKAAELFERACRLGEADGCFNLGVLTYDGAGVPRDPTRAFALFVQACDAGKAVACVNVGAAYDDGDGVAPDPTRAAALFKRACEGDEARGCYDLAYLYARGRGVPADAAQAARYYDRACALGNGEGCGELAARTLAGNGVDPDPARAAQLFDRACNLGLPSACARLGRPAP